MTHETLKALYQLDVDEVGEEEAAKRWEWFNPRFLVIWTTHGAGKPQFLEDVLYRRKPGIPWPKVMQSNDQCWREAVLDQCMIAHCAFDDCNPRKTLEGLISWHIDVALDPQVSSDAQALIDKGKAMQQPSTQWPDDAPEWANYGIITFYKHGGLTVNSADQLLIERPKQPKQKIDWSKLLESLKWVEYEITHHHKTNWIAWNCDEHTRGNPLPDGLVVEWLYGGDGFPYDSRHENIEWKYVTRFRIVGIKDGFE